MALVRTTIAQLKELLSALGVTEGEAVMVHSSVITLGRMEQGLDGLYEAIRDVIGPNGTLIVPTFTYSFRRHEVFDVRNSPTPPSLGAFSEHVRTLPGTVRSMDPLFSMAAAGPEAAHLMERTSHNCFGASSTYERLFERDVRFVGLGITYSTGFTCFVHLERLAGIDYRRDERFDGRSVGYDGTATNDWAIHFIRDEDRYSFVYADRDPVGKSMEAMGLSTAVSLGSGHHISFRAQPVGEFILDLLRRNPHAMLPAGASKRL